MAWDSIKTSSDKLTASEYNLLVAEIKRTAKKVLDLPFIINKLTALAEQLNEYLNDPREGVSKSEYTSLVNEVKELKNSLTSINNNLNYIKEEVNKTSPTSVYDEIKEIVNDIFETSKLENEEYRDTGIIKLTDDKTSSYKLVEIGTDVLWADRNLGASSPYDPGLYVTYENNNTQESIAGTDNDPVTKMLGEPWRMASKEDFELLYKSYSQPYLVLNNEPRHYLLKGGNGLDLIFPASGYKTPTDAIKDPRTICYWLPENTSQSYANSLTFGYFPYYLINTEKVLRMPVRPVYDTNRFYVPIVYTEIGKQALSIDLGLDSGNLWASYNIGSTTPTLAGLSYAWAETEPKDTYNKFNYRFWNSSQNTIIYDIKEYTGEKEYDAARVAWGGDWRTPTEDDWDELYRNCLWEDKESYYLVTGPNGNSITLPKAEYNTSTYDHFHYGREEYDWCYYAEVTSTRYNSSRGSNYIGRQIRPIRNNSYFKNGGKYAHWPAYVMANMNNDGRFNVVMNNSMVGTFKKGDTIKISTTDLNCLFHINLSQPENWSIPTNVMKDYSQYDGAGAYRAVSPLLKEVIITCTQDIKYDGNNIIASLAIQLNPYWNGQTN